MRERNRLAAQKWRKKKEGYLTDLEDANDALRQEAFKLANDVHSLRIENGILEEQLNFFHQMMRNMVSQAGRHL
jgi:hypothetical protein